MRTMFYLHLAIGLCLFVMGFIASARPYLLLDVVLTKQELRDTTKVNSAMNLLRQGSGIDSVLFFGTGIILVSTSLIALRRSQRVAK